jgi:hypothetical protein
MRRTGRRDAAAPPRVSDVASLRGDLQERADGGFEGWCWAPDRPNERLQVDLLVNGIPAASMIAAMFRRDLFVRGCGDGRHGFALHLPDGADPGSEECVITARERRSGRVFGQILRSGGGRRPPWLARISPLATAAGALATDVATLQAARGRTALAAPLRAAFGQLATTLAAQAAGTPYPGAVPAALRAGLPFVADPLLTLVLVAHRATATLGRVAALAPGLADAAAEILVADPGTDPAAALLPAAVPRLHYLRDDDAARPDTAFRHAAAAARGRVVVLLDAAPAFPSAAALLALARAAAGAQGRLLLATAVAAASPPAPPPLPVALRLPAAFGLLIGIERSLCRALGAADAGPTGGTHGACADLALRARLLGHPWQLVQEPTAPARAAIGA